MPRAIDVQTAPNALTVQFDGGQCGTFDYLWLRDNCPTAFHPETRERALDLLTVSEDIHPLNVHITAEGVRIDWSEGDHQSHYRADWLLEQLRRQNQRYQPDLPMAGWTGKARERLAGVDFKTLMQDDHTLLAWMRDLGRYGLSRISGVPSTDSALIDVAERIDRLRATNFGEVFEVRSKADPNNLAYTAMSLPLHTDLPNQETPPGFQFLHCLHNEAEGGESVYADGFQILSDLRVAHPEEFEWLASKAIPFRFHDETHDIRHHHPVINLDHAGNIQELKFNAHIADIFDLPAEDIRPYYRAYRRLMAFVRSERYALRYRMTAGDLVVFDNRRVLHGRDAFDPTTGERHLRGCYVDRTEFLSRLRVLERSLG